MDRRQALIDNDALVNLTHLANLGMFDLMRNLFFRIHIPLEIKNEYERQIGKEPQRAYILRNLLPDRGFWSLCTTYDSFSDVFLFNYKGIDKGEAELVSQGEKIKIRLIISDDRNFKKAVETMNKPFLLVSSLFIIAALDINGYISGHKEFLKTLYPHRPFKAAQLRAAYELALKEYGIHWTKKLLSQKIRLKEIKEELSLK